MNSTRTVSTALAGALLAIAACGGKSSTTSSSTTTPDPTTPTAALPPGSTGYPGLDWGDDAASVQADYPDAVKAGDQLERKATHAGRDATVSFAFASNDVLVAIDVEYPDAFASMPACGEVLHQVRPELDAALGDGGEDNLAVFWSSDSFEAVLSCNPLEDGGDAASLTMSYTMVLSEE